MKKTAIVMTVTALLSTPAHAAEWSDVSPGTFIGARLTIGGNGGARPRAALTIAPTQTRTGYDGFSRTRTGEGIALNFMPGSKPTFTLAGVRPDQALGLTSGPTTDHRTKSGMSDGAKVAIGVGAGLALVAGGAFLYLSSRCTECDQ